MGAEAVFYFYILYFRFLQKYIFVFEIDMNIPWPPRCRAAGIWPPGSRAAGAYPQKKDENKLQTGPWGPDGRPPPLYKVLAAPHPLICLTKNPEKKKREGGRERRGEGEAKRRSPVGF